jgi:hypothetical protein
LMESKSDACVPDATMVEKTRNWPF